ncbi:M56 family metallopeptidase [Galbibacter pacificus]|uniref:TonB-dependent receptor plug domain-containing protein n=1 Tax=Galbibacter pacificus TaxID=2996052 RepID=A0ABT6FV77_9FLAO|nr:M56 family metallopeptidase [Galbibacter pacificus]MDG3583926.1 TonB-dependent receptor plug domain-containing protein [Galbibacter pacificus]MDG3587156.1 TonB-dependent receptor plug domain-containing protein [Galbibacter pacificus]
MEAFAIYLLKASGLLAVFWLMYVCLLNKTTFYKQNRFYLLGGLLISALLPLVVYKKIVLVEAINTLGKNIDHVATYTTQGHDYTQQFLVILAMLYLMGALFFFGRFCIQLYSLYHFMKKETHTKEEGFMHVSTSKDISPFSFFKFIVYNPKKYTEEELTTILRHEKIHAWQLHTIDILFAHLYTVVFWFSPFSWLYKKAIGENLEYLTDKETTTSQSQTKNYQYLLLKQISGIPYSVINPFYYSSTSLTAFGYTFTFGKRSGQVKKRIVMLQKQKTNKTNLLRYTLIIPFLAGFMMLFSFKTETKLALNTEVSQNSNLPEYVITKDFSAEDLKQLQAKVKEDGGSLTYSNIKRTNTGEISNIQVTYETKKGGKATGTSSNKGKGIENLYFGIGEGGGVYIIVGSAYTKNQRGVIIAATDQHTMDKKPLIVLNGKIMPKDFDTKSIQPDAIESINVLKDKNASDKYDVQGKNGVIEITLKNKTQYNPYKVTGASEAGTRINFKGEKPLILVDGKTMPADFDLNSISPDTIKQVSVLKDENAIKQYGEKGKDGVILITTKKE